jgi:two-component system, NtrC family, sensor histidine kinase HupT/HoxJ
MTADTRAPPSRTTLLAAAAISDETALGGASEAMWFEVVRKMDEVYSDLLRYEADLEQKNAQLEEAQAFISSVIASMSDMLVVCDGQGRILQANPSFAKMIGQSEDKLVGSVIVDHLVEADRAPMLGLIDSESQLTRDVDLRFGTATGESDLMAMHCSARFDPNRRRSGVVLTGRPISELRRAYEALNNAHLELQRAQRKLIAQEKIASLGRLVAGVAHELNNPISFVFGNIHTLDRYRKNLVEYLAAVHAGVAAKELAERRRRLRIDAIVADLQPLIDGTLEGAARVSDIVKNLRRLSSNRVGERQPVDLGKVARAATHLALRSKKVHADVAFDIDPNVPSIPAHEGQIHQVIVNLIDNALDAMRNVAEPQIKVSIKAVGREVEIAVADNGCGIDNDVADKIFDPFFTTKEVGEGSGLGLWISSTIIRDHSGTLTVASSPGKGSVFTLRLPRDGEVADGG